MENQELETQSQDILMSEPQTETQEVSPGQDPNAIVYHPLLIIERDNFTFNPPEMDAAFYEALYGLHLKLEVIKTALQDQELNHLSNYLTTFLMSCAYKCQQDGLIDKPMFKDWDAKLKEIGAKLTEKES